MKQKEIATALGLSVALTMTGCASNEINQIKSETTVELGSDCNIEASEYFELGSKVDSSAIAFDTSAVDTNTVGDYVITVSFKKNTYSINVSVVDTTAPILSVKENIEPVERGKSINASDYAEVDDESGVNVFWVAEDGETDTLDIPDDLDSSVTEINYTLVAIDESGNRSEEKQITITISEDEEPLHDTEADGKIEATNSKNKYMGMTADELLALMASPEFSKISSEEQNMILEAYGITQEDQGAKTIPQSEIDKMTHAEVEEKLFGDDGSSWEQYTNETVDALWKRFDETNPNNANKLIEQHNQEISGGGQTGPVDCETPPCDAYDASICQADGWICY